MKPNEVSACAGSSSSCEPTVTQLNTENAVYVVADGEYEDYEIKGVFDDYDKAREYQEQNNFDYLEIYFLNDPEKEFETFLIQINQDGTGIIQCFNKWGKCKEAYPLNSRVLPRIDDPVVEKLIHAPDRYYAGRVADKMYRKLEEK